MVLRECRGGVAIIINPDYSLFQVDEVQKMGCRGGAERYTGRKPPHSLSLTRVKKAISDREIEE
jgi:hypothetical protein